MTAMGGTGTAMQHDDATRGTTTATGDTTTGGSTTSRGSATTGGTTTAMGGTTAATGGTMTARAAGQQGDGRYNDDNGWHDDAAR